MPTTAYSLARMLSFGCEAVFAVAVLCNVALSGEDPPIAFGANVQAILKTHCTACHGQNVQEGGLNLTERDRLLAGGESGPAIVPGAPEASLLLQKILSGDMPPEDPKPTAGEIAVLRRWIADGALRTGERPEEVRLLFAQMHVSEAEIMSNIFSSYCITCHGKLRQEAGLDLRTRASMLKGGNSGPALVVDRPAESLVYQKILADEMPPKKNIFGDQQYVYRVQAGDIDRLKLWIELGAPEDEVSEPAFRRDEPQSVLSDTDTPHWAFQPIQQPAVPEADVSVKPLGAGASRNPVDAFLLQELGKRDLNFSAPADRMVLLRRAYFDLIGLPPSPDDVQAWLADDSVDALDRLIDRLLDSRHYGERWARHWLDVAGYSDTHGVIDRDELRRYMWRYRDYVIRSFNEDKPYDQFLLEQVAGDELVDWKSDTPLTAQQIDGLVATGFLRTAPDATDEGGFNKIVDRFAVVNEQLDIFSTAVMGITMECSRCHSHKFDPISQRDYYRFAAIFRSSMDPYDWRIPNEVLYPPRYDVPSEYQRYIRHPSDVLTPEVRRYNDRIDAKCATIEQQIEKAAAPFREQLREAGAEGTAEQQPAANATVADLAKQFPDFAKQTSRQRQQLSELRARRFDYMLIHGLKDLGGRSTPVHVLRRGDLRSPMERVQPGVPHALAASASPFKVTPPEHSTKTSGSRLALARWLTTPEHPLTARVMVNRIWMHHFGLPLVTTTGNFGHSGATPTHPELLDWLAAEFIRRDWSIKEMHRLIMRSSAWQQSSVADGRRHKQDPDNLLLSRFPFRRLDAEQIRDTVLQVSGQLDLTPFGPADEIQETAEGEVVSQASKDGYRRSIYLIQRRLKPETMLALFDAPAMVPNCLQRTRSTVAPQALQLFNSGFMRKAAAHFAEQVIQLCGHDQKKQVEHIYVTTLSRYPTSAEVQQATEALKNLTRLWQDADNAKQTVISDRDPQHQALTVFCHTIMNSPEFIYTD